MKLKLKWTPLLQENRVLNITNNSAQQNILHLFNTTDQVHAYITKSSSRDDYEIKFSRLDKQVNKANYFQDWGPKYGIAYLRVLEIFQNKALKREYSKNPHIRT